MRKIKIKHGDFEYEEYVNVSLNPTSIETRRVVEEMQMVERDKKICKDKEFTEVTETWNPFFVGVLGLVFLVGFASMLRPASSGYYPQTAPTNNINIIGK